MPKPGVYRSPWGDFPDVIIQTTVHKLRSRSAYEEAKRGVGEAAFEVIQELIKARKNPLFVRYRRSGQTIRSRQAKRSSYRFMRLLSPSISTPTWKPVSSNSTSCRIPLRTLRHASWVNPFSWEKSVQGAVSSSSMMLSPTVRLSPICEAGSNARRSVKKPFSNKHHRRNERDHRCGERHPA